MVKSLDCGSADGDNGKGKGKGKRGILHTLKMFAYHFVAVLWQFQFKNSSVASFKAVYKQCISPSMAKTKRIF